MNQRQIAIDGYKPEEILELPDEQIDAFVFCGEPLVFTVGTAQILGEFRITNSTLQVELAQIDGGGEGVLPTLWSLAERYARQRTLLQVEWVVHALNCAKPNPKLQPLLLRKGFKVESLPSGVRAYHLVYAIGLNQADTT